ncbi:hypothetical protein [Paenibacillus massiliensis]|uniref:hypothetical protein n=1 Tax=Paenibacillus massiliensis TaxID=225917 RepID=UPI00037EEF9C|nr:hypothetical protein [Paenibacillus massiliensis]
MPDTHTDQKQANKSYSSYVLIAWIALTFFFTTIALVGLVVQSTGGNVEPYTKVGISTLVLIAGGAIVLIEALTKFMVRPEDDETDQDAADQRPHVPERASMNIRSILAYVVLVAVILIGGLLLRGSLPVFTISPWTSLIIGIVGWVVLIVIMWRRSQRRKTSV